MNISECVEDVIIDEIQKYSYVYRKDLHDHRNEDLIKQAFANIASVLKNDYCRLETGMYNEFYEVNLNF